MKNEQEVMKELRKRIGRRPNSYNNKISNEGFCKGLVWVLTGLSKQQLTLSQISGLFKIIVDTPKFKREK